MWNRIKGFFDYNNPNYWLFTLFLSGGLAVSALMSGNWSALIGWSFCLHYEWREYKRLSF